MRAPDQTANAITRGGHAALCPQDVLHPGEASTFSQARLDHRGHGIARRSRAFYHTRVAEEHVQKAEEGASCLREDHREDDVGLEGAAMANNAGSRGARRPNQDRAQEDNEANAQKGFYSVRSITQRQRRQLLDGDLPRSITSVVTLFGSGISHLLPTHYRGRNG